MAIRILRGEVKNSAGYFCKGETAELPAAEEKQLVAAGRAAYIISEQTKETPGTLQDMTLVQLREYAEKNGIDLKGAASKPQVIEAIQAAEE